MADGASVSPLKFTLSGSGSGRAAPVTAVGVVVEVVAEEAAEAAEAAEMEAVAAADVAAAVSGRSKRWQAVLSYTTIPLLGSASMVSGSRLVFASSAPSRAS